MSARGAAIVSIFACALPWTACNKSQTSARPSAATASPAAAPAAPPATPAPNPQLPESAQGIRGANLKDFLEKHLAELNPDLADLATDCGEGQAPIQSLAPVHYGDLDGDGQEEAALEGWSCLSGNGGADFFGVLKLMPDGKLAVLPIEPMPKLFKGRNPYEGLRGHVRLEISGGKLAELYPVYPDEKSCNTCSEGERRFRFRWNGQQFVLDDIIDVPPAKSGS